jgi:hypothetical protein
MDRQVLDLPIPLALILIAVDDYARNRAEKAASGAAAKSMSLSELLPILAAHTPAATANAPAGQGFTTAC